MVARTAAQGSQERTQVLCAVEAGALISMRQTRQGVAGAVRPARCID